MNSGKRTILIGQVVRRAGHVPPNPRHRRNRVRDLIGRSIPGVGGCAAVHLSPHRDYTVTGITSHGGLVLQDFLLPVSVRDVVVVTR